MSFGLTATLEKPTRGKPVREGVFIISELQRKCLLQHIHFQKINDKLISKTMPSLHIETNKNLKFVPEFPALMYRFAPHFLCLIVVWLP